MGVLDNFAIDSYKIDGAIGSIESIQHGTASIVSNATSATININSVDASKSIVLLTWRSEDFYVGDMPTAKIISNTQVRFDRGYNSPNFTFIRWTVIEFKNVRSKQSGEEYNSTSGQTDITISPVNTNKSILVGTMRRYSSGTALMSAIYTVEFYSSTQIRFTFVGILDTYLVWQVVEFD